MPLSDHEQRLLEQMEEALYAEDPKFANQLVGSRAGAAGRTRVILGALVAIAGLALIVLAIVVFGGTSWVIWIGALGFAVMVAGGAWALTPQRGRSKQGLGAVADDGSVGRTHTKDKGSKRRGAQSRTKNTQGTFMERLEQRWDRRRHER